MNGVVDMKAGCSMGFWRCPTDSVTTPPRRSNDDFTRKWLLGIRRCCVTKPTPYYDESGEEWRPVCGEPIRGLFTAMPCCLDPEHPDEHMFAAYHARYRVVDGKIYEREGRG
jgi:hypothetical protein